MGQGMQGEYLHWGEHEAVIAVAAATAALSLISCLQHVSWGTAHRTPPAPACTKLAHAQATRSSMCPDLPCLAAAGDTRPYLCPSWA